MLAAFSFLACAASFGLFLSVRSPTVQRASASWLLFVGLWVGSTFLAAEAAYVEERVANRSLTRRGMSAPNQLVWDRVVNPPLAWSALSFRLANLPDEGYSWQRDEWQDGVVHNADDVWPALAGVGVYGLLAWVFYRLASARFEREGRT
jgi:hypothetical protein